jgi:hypothetical protein
MHTTDEMWQAKKLYWSEKLSDLKAEQIKRALDACNNSPMPDLPKFREMALGFKPTERTHHQAYLDYVPPKLPKPASQEIIDKFLKEAREALSRENIDYGVGRGRLRKCNSD